MENKEFESSELLPKQVDNIFILLHGFGSNKDDFLQLANDFRFISPNTAFIALNAPRPSEVGEGYQWFSLKTMNLFSILRDIKISNNYLNDFIDRQLERFKLTNDNLIIAGFSQGAMMTLYTGLRREKKPLALLAFSGMMAETIETLKKEIKCRPDTLLINGTLDRTVPFSSLEKSENLLREFDVPFESYPIQNMGHTINVEAIEVAKNFIKDIYNRAD